MSKDNIVYTVIIGLLIICVAGIYDSKPMFGGLIHNVQESFDAGIAVNGTEIIDSSGNYVGALTGTTGTLSSTLTVTGATTLSGAIQMTDNVHIDDTASSTIQIGSTADGIGVGCIVIGDSGGATSTPVYITATGATITATTTKPAICK